MLFCGPLPAKMTRYTLRGVGVNVVSDVRLPCSVGTHHCDLTSPCAGFRVLGARH